MEKKRKRDLLRDSDKGNESKMLIDDVSSSKRAPESVPALSSETGLNRSDGDLLRLDVNQRRSLRRKLSRVQKQADLLNVTRDKLVAEEIFSNKDVKCGMFTPQQISFLRWKLAAFRPADFDDKGNGDSHGCDTLVKEVVKEEVFSRKNASLKPVESVMNVSPSSESKEEESDGQLTRSKMKRKAKRRRRRERDKEQKRLMALENNEGNRMDNASSGFDSTSYNKVASGKELKIEAGKEDIDSVSQGVEMKSSKESLVTSENRNDSPINTGAIVLEGQDVRNKVDDDLSGSKELESFQGKDGMKKFKRKRRKTSDTSGGNLELIKENDTKDSLVISENRSHPPSNINAGVLEDQDVHKKVDDGLSGSKELDSFRGKVEMKKNKRKRRKSSVTCGGNSELIEDDTQEKHNSTVAKEKFDPSEQVMEQSTGQIPGSLSACKDIKKKKKRLKSEEASRGDIVMKDASETTRPKSLERLHVFPPKKKLLVLDLNGILMDVVAGGKNSDITVSGKAVYMRPFCNDFLAFCFERFNVGVWSSRLKENVAKLVNFIFGKSKQKLLFCWHQAQCTKTRFRTIDKQNKPIVLKELRKLWDKWEPGLPWEKGEYNESNTLLVDDSPYKALHNPAHTAIFPFPYHHNNTEDSSLGPGGDIRAYLEGIAAADSVQTYVEQNPFGQPFITESDPSWNFYLKVRGTNLRFGSS